MIELAVIHYVFKSGVTINTRLWLNHKIKKDVSRNQQVLSLSINLTAVWTWLWPLALALKLNVSSDLYGNVPSPGCQRGEQKGKTPELQDRAGPLWARQDGDECDEDPPAG